MEDKIIHFNINHKVFSVNIGLDKDNQIEDGIKKFIDPKDSLTVQDILMAYIKKTHELVEYERSLYGLSHKIENIKNI